MIDWVLDHGIPWIIGALLLLLAFCVVMIFVSVGHESKRREELMQQCLADGHKEYECESMLKRDDTAIIPMPIPMVIPR